jgi:hypothetical protein
MPVPLVVKAPLPAGGNAGVADTPVQLEPGSRDNRVAETIDVLPTVADLLGVDLPWSVDGHSLFGPRRTNAERSIYARGNTVHTDARHLDVQPIVDRIHDTFGRGDHLELYGLGPGRSLIGLRARPRALDEAPAACWSGATVPDGSVGEVRGALQTDEDAGEVAFAVVVDGRVAGTSVTFDDGEGESHRVVALADPAGWGSGDDVELWQVVDDGAEHGLVRLPDC